MRKMETTCWFSLISAGIFVVLPLSNITLAQEPGDLGDLYLWVKQDTLAGLTDGDPVETWADSSPSNTPMNATVGIPTYSSNAINGHPAVHFEFAHSMASGDGALLGGNPEFTIIVLLSAAQIPSAGGALHPVNWGNGNAPGGGSALELEYVSGRVDWATGFGQDATTENFIYEPHWAVPKIISLRRTSGPTNNARISLDGTELAVGGSDAIPAIQKSPIRLGGGGGGFFPIIMDLAEAIIYTRSLTDFEENAVGFYLEEKYGLETAYDEPNAVFTLTVEVSPSDAGIDTVIPSVGTHFVGEGQGPQAISASIFDPCPDVFIFDHWEGDDVAEPSDAETTVFMDADKTVTAVFVDGRACPDKCREAPASDSDDNCIIDIIDFDAFVANWLMNFNPQ